MALVALTSPVALGGPKDCILVQWGQGREVRQSRGLLIFVRWVDIHRYRYKDKSGKICVCVCKTRKEVQASMNKGYNMLKASNIDDTKNSLKYN